MTDTLGSLGITAEKISAYDQRIPRYTSYPTAPIWTHEFGPDEYRSHLEKNAGSSTPLSLYVHLPFCAKHCLFCACNVIITSKKGVAEDYLDYLEREIALVADLYKSKGQAIQLHLGGGTPNYLTMEQMNRLVKALDGAFHFTEDAERSIEVDPRVATPEQMQILYDLHGFRRISFGVQDFHAETQQAIGRGQTKDITFANVAAARACGFRSVNIDLIYGLPRQTAESWSETLDSICQLRPDRIALYNFAYLPGKLAHQRALEAEILPEPGLKLQMFIEAHNRLTSEGWEFIGMDHYALKEDSLTKAQEAGSLRRNFMGYTTLRGTNMLSFGTTAISDCHGAFAQNEKKLSVYKRMVTEGVLPVERGLLLSDEDIVRRYIIKELMCNGMLRYDADAGAPADLRAIVKEVEPQLATLAADGLLTMEPEGVRVTRKGRMFLRNIAVVFDVYVQRAADKNVVYSRAV